MPIDPGLEPYMSPLRSFASLLVGKISSRRFPMGEKPHGAVGLAAAGALSAFLGGGVCYLNKEDKQEPVARKLTDGEYLKESFILTDGEFLKESFILTDGKFLKESIILSDGESLKESFNARGSDTFETNDFSNETEEVRPGYRGGSVPTTEEFEMLKLRLRELRSETS